MVLNCDDTSTEPQDIRLVCVDESEGCLQTFEGGAESTIIRLPENCAGILSHVHVRITNHDTPPGGPYARASHVWDEEDQFLPLATNLYSPESSAFTRPLKRDNAF